jgi:hypothetical protein
MSSSQVQFAVAGRQLTPVTFKTQAIDTVPSNTIAPVWPTRKRPAVNTRWAPEEVLMDIYAEEFHVENHSLVEDDVEETAVLLNDSFRTASVLSRHDSVMEQDLPVFVAKPVRDEQQVCRPYAVQATTLLFDVAMPYDSDVDLALYNDLHPEVPTALSRTTETALEYSPTPELLDTSDLKFQPTIAAGPLRDPVSQMLYFEYPAEVQETASEPAPKRQGRSLVCPIPLYTVAELDALEADELYNIDEQGSTSKRQLTFFSSDNSPRDWKVEYDRVLRQVTGGTFLPGLEHLTSVEVRSAFVTYDSDIAALQQATAEFIADRHDGECFCLDNKAGAVIPGENVLLADNNTGLGLSVQRPTAQSLLSFIDSLVDDEAFIERPDSPLLAPSYVEEPLRPGALFDAASSQYVGYTALDHVLGHSHNVSDTVCKQSVAAGDVSDTYGEDIEALSTPCLSELTYFDADHQQLVGFTAFNQLLVDMSGDEVLTRIHREDYGLDDEDIFIEGVLEINEVRQMYQLSDPQSSLPSQPDVESFDFGSDGASDSYVTNTALPRSATSLRSYSSRRRSRRHPQLTITTQLSDIVEVLSDEDHAQSSTSSSDASINFAEHRGFVQALSARRADFLDDEDSDDGMDAPQSAGTPSSPDFVSIKFPPVSPTVERTIVIQYFDNSIWHHNADLYLAMPLSPVDPYSPSADNFPDIDILESLETELYELIANLFTYLNNRQLTDAQKLGVDLEWALSAITSVFPQLGLLQRLGVTVEILLELVISSGNN